MSTVNSSRSTLRFSGFELDPAGDLRSGGKKVKLQDQPLQILRILTDHAGEIVTREELCQKIWPSDTFVDFDHGINNAIKRLREALGDTSDTPRYIETLPRRGYRFIGKIESEAPRMRSLAVLPLEDLSHDPQQEYFAEGLTEALITALAKIGELRVVSRTSAMQYKGIRKPLREIAKELEVDAIVEGTVLRAGRRVRITAQLIDAPKETHLWAESYERDMRNVLVLQSEIAQAIAREVRVKLTPQEQAQFGQERPVDPEAYEAYLKGRYYWNRRSGEGLGKSVWYFEQAILKDPTYAAAYSGLADGLTISAAWSLLPPDEGCRKARKLALQALGIDSSSAEAHASLAFATMWYDYDFSTAEREFERSIELNPRYATAHEWFGIMLGLMGRFNEAYTEAKRAMRLDPCSSVMPWALAFVYWCGRHYDEAIEQCQKSMELDSGFTPAYWQLGVVHLNQHAYGPAICALQRADGLSPGVPMISGYMGAAHAAAGDFDAAQKILHRLDERSREQYVSPYLFALIYAALDKKEEALQWLEVGYERRAEWMVLLKTAAGMDSLRSEPRFQDLMRRMNFPL